MTMMMVMVMVMEVMAVSILIVTRSAASQAWLVLAPQQLIISGAAVHCKATRSMTKQQLTRQQMGQQPAHVPLHLRTRLLGQARLKA